MSFLDRIQFGAKYPTDVTFPFALMKLATFVSGSMGTPYKLSEGLEKKDK